MEGGNWLNVTNGYLGFDRIHSEKHYGWARIEMKYAEIPLKATIVGYADSRQIGAGRAVALLAPQRGRNRSV